MKMETPVEARSLTAIALQGNWNSGEVSSVVCGLLFIYCCSSETGSVTSTGVGILPRCHGPLEARGGVGGDEAGALTLWWADFWGN